MNVLFITLALACFVSVHSATWDYADPSKWGDNYPYCKGNKQSPVDINSVKAQPNLNLRMFTLKGFNSMLNFDIVNNGHTVKLTPPQSADITSSGGGFTSPYKVIQFHFHWSETMRTKGSEHLLDGKAFPLELHIVQMNTMYDNVTEALKHPDGLAVFGFFFVKGPENQGLSKFVTKFPAEGTMTTSEKFSLLELIQTEKDMEKYFRYHGSLTTPPCSEAVVWTVFKKILTLSEPQMNAFYDFKDRNGNTMSNYRPAQSLNGRKIWRNFQPSSGTMTTAFSVLVFSSLFMVTNLW